MAIRSDFNYILPAELPRFIHKMSSVTNETTAARFISDAERLVDAYVGPGPRFYFDEQGDITTDMASGAVVVTSSIWSSRRPNYWAQGGVYVRLIGPAGLASGLIGQERLVIASDGESVTLASGFDVAVPAGTEFSFRQVSSFPRLWDQDPFGTPQLPFLLKQGVAAQVEYGIFFGSEAFGLGDESVVTDEGGDVQSRTYGTGYSESRDTRRRDGLAVWVAPKTRALLRQLLSSTGWMRS